MRDSIDSRLSTLYQGIITYENEVLDEYLAFFVVNKLISYEQELDLTLLIE